VGVAARARRCRGLHGKPGLPAAGLGAIAALDIVQAMAPPPMPIRSGYHLRPAEAVPRPRGSRLRARCGEGGRPDAGSAKDSSLSRSPGHSAARRLDPCGSRLLAGPRGPGVLRGWRRAFRDRRWGRFSLFIILVDHAAVGLRLGIFRASSKLKGWSALRRWVAALAVRGAAVRTGDWRVLTCSRRVGRWVSISAPNYTGMIFAAVCGPSCSCTRGARLLARRDLWNSALLAGGASGIL